MTVGVLPKLIVVYMLNHLRYVYSKIMSHRNVQSYHKKKNHGVIFVKLIKLIQTFYSKDKKISLNVGQKHSVS